MTIKVLGSGCANCKRLLQITQKAVEELKLQAEVLYITDMMEIAQAGIMKTPGLIINNQIASYGRIPTLEEVKIMLKGV
jgi:small redox-active disulfide protein 2